MELSKSILVEKKEELNKKINRRELQQMLEEVIKKEKIKGRFLGNIKVLPVDKKPHFKAYTQMVNKDITIKYNPLYEEKQKGKSQVVVRDLTRHEINHYGYEGFKGCPKDRDIHFEKFIVPISKVLIPKGYTPKDVIYIANAVEDTILHTDLNKKFPLEGIYLFFRDTGESNGNEYTNFYEAHVKLNMFLWGNKKQKRGLRHLYKHHPDVKEALTNFLKRTGIYKLRDEVGYYERDKIREFLTNEDKWEKIAEIFAEEFGKLLEPGYALPLINHSGAGTRGREDEESEDEGNIFDKEIRNKEFKEKKVWEYYKKSKEKGDITLPPIFNRSEALDLLYQKLTKQLKIKVESDAVSKKFAYTSIGKEPFDPQRHKPKRLTFGFDDKGNIRVMRKKYPLYVDINIKHKRKGIPEVRYILLDTSGTMMENPEGIGNIGNTNIIPWGDNSKYHYALLAWYGFLHYLKANNLLQETSITLVNFSNEDLIGRGLKKAKEVALRPQFGNTYLKKETVEKVFKGHNALIYTISDGEIYNWEEIKEEFIKGAKNHYYFHLQIGERNEFTYDLEKNKLPVYYVRGNEDLSELVIDLTRSFYKPS